MSRTLSIDDYEITKEGEVINKRTGHKLKPQPNGKGYLRVSIGGKLKFVHRLVAEQYLPNPDNKPQVNHKDGNKLNNNLSNLEWVSNEENRKHAVENNLISCGENSPNAKLTKADVLFIRAHPEIDEWILADMLNVARSTILDVRYYRAWKRI